MLKSGQKYNSTLKMCAFHCIRKQGQNKYMDNKKINCQKTSPIKLVLLKLYPSSQIYL